MGFIPSCDPNYYFPSDPNSLGGGPYSIFRRCLYGKEVSNYQLDYAQQFLTKYKDQSKLLHMDFVEAHEGTGEVVAYLDTKLFEMLRWIEANGHVYSLHIRLVRGFNIYPSFRSRTTFKQPAGCFQG
jgi:hypothetical protein